MTEDLPFNLVDGPTRYATTTDKPVQYVTVADRQGAVLGYVWSNDEDDAAGYMFRRAGGDNAFNAGSLYVSSLHDAKARGINPTDALTELVRKSDPADPSHVVPGSLAHAPNVDAVKDLAGDG